MFITHGLEGDEMRGIASKAAARILALAAVFMFALFLGARPAHADDYVWFSTPDGLEYGQDIESNLWAPDGYDGGVYVSAYYGDAPSITVPSEVTYNGKTYCVTAIGTGGLSFYDEHAPENLTEVILPDTIKEFYPEAFWGTHISSIDLPEGLKVIGDRAFNGSWLSDTIEIPASVEIIGHEAFLDCNHWLNTMRCLVPKGQPLSIGNYAFGYETDDEGNYHMHYNITIETWEGSAMDTWAQANAFPEIRYFYAYEITSKSLDLGTVEVGAFNGEDLKQAITITNTGTKTFDLGWAGLEGMYEIVGPDTSSIQPGESRTLTFIPYNNAPIGDYSHVATLYPQAPEGEPWGGFNPTKLQIHFEVVEHIHEWKTEWYVGPNTHWHECAKGCGGRGSEGAHDENALENYRAATFDVDGYTGDKYCSVCGKPMGYGSVVAAGKYIRHSTATMAPAVLTPNLCPNDLVFTPGDSSKYTVSLVKVWDDTDKVYLSGDEHFIAGHTYTIQVKFRNVSPYEYDEQHSTHWSDFYINGIETDTPLMIGGSTVRNLEDVVAVQPATGWQKIDGYWYYFYSDGTVAASKWIKDSKGWCYLGADGKMVASGFAKDSKGWCYVGANGYMVVATKWIKLDGIWYHITKGYRDQSKWMKDSKGWCYLGADGKMVANGWAKDSKGWCWMGSDGYWVANKWVKDGEEWYFIKSNHYMAANEWTKDSKGWMYMGSNGKITKAKWVKSGSYWYYLKPDGYMATGTIYIGDKAYTFDSKGHWIS